jgi:hypothetical protein
MKLFEERVIRLMPENMKPIWGQLNESSKKSILFKLDYIQKKY